MMKLKFDSNDYTRCHGCFEPILPDEEKIVVGTVDGKIEVFCLDCEWGIK